MKIELNAASRLRASTKITSGRGTGEGAGALFFAEDSGKFLICKRSNTGDAAGQWCCLGGGVDDTDTSYEHTVRREANEEGGFPYDAPCSLWHVNTAQVSPTFWFHNYLASVPCEFKPKLNDEHTDYKWVTYNELLKHPDMHEGMMNALDTDFTKYVLNKRCHLLNAG